MEKPPVFEGETGGFSYRLPNASRQKQGITIARKTMTAQNTVVS